MELGTAAWIIVPILFLIAWGKMSGSVRHGVARAKSFIIFADAYRRHHEEKSPPEFARVGPQAARISYTHLGKKYSVWVPYYSGAAREPERIVTAMMPDGPLRLTQQPGVPLLVSPDELGADSVTVCEIESGITQLYSGAMRPCRK